MTRVYFCWTNREPEFQHFLPGARLLVSPSLLTRAWNVQAWNVMPQCVMVDSGTFTQTKRKGVLDVRTCLQAQLRILEGWPTDRSAFLIHFDTPLPPSLPFDEYQARVKLNLEFAAAYITQFPRLANLVPVAVIHALDGETLAASYLELRDMGYRHFALGSLVALLYRSRNRLRSLLEICRELGLEDLHVLGIASPSVLKGLLGPWIGSFDSSAPVRQAICGTIFYSRPFERFVLRPTGRQALGNRSFGNREPLHTPRPCACPVCADDPIGLLCSDESEARQRRKIHNAFHLLEEVASWTI